MRPVVPSHSSPLAIHTVTYLALSFISGFIELGVLLFAYRKAFPLVAIPLLGIAYQAGALLCKPVRISYHLSIIAGILGLVFALFSSRSLIVLILAIGLLSLAVHKARELSATQCRVSTFHKRLARVVGFAFAPCFAPVILWLVGIIIVTLFCIRWACTFRESPRVFVERLTPTPLGVTMLLHQSHYFLYSCFIPLLILQTHRVHASLLGVAFCFGWISYSITPFLFRRLPTITVFVAGHILAALTLFGMVCFSKNVIILLLGWFVSGFGGGTVYCLRALEQLSEPDRIDLDAWENIGHIAGLLLSLIIILSTGQPTYAFNAAAIMALITPAFLIANRRSVCFAQKGSVASP